MQTSFWRRVGLLTGTAVAAVSGIPTASAAAVAVAPGTGAVVDPLSPFTIQLPEGEYGQEIYLYRRLQDAAADDAAGVGPLKAVTVATVRGDQDPAAGQVLTPYEPMLPGVWFWRVGASAPPGAAAPLFRVSVPIQIRVRRVVQMTGVRITRRGAQVTASYVWRTNSPQLIHRTEVFYQGHRIRRTQSTIKHSPGRRMKGERFTATAALTRNRPPFGSIHPGPWVVRFTISDGVKAVSVSRRYVFPS